MDIETQAEYQVEEILQEKYFKGKPHYLVKWRGYPKSQSTWQPIENMEHALTYLIEWKKQKIRDDRKEKKSPNEVAILNTKKTSTNNNLESKRKTPRKPKTIYSKRNTKDSEAPWKNLKESLGNSTQTLLKPVVSRMNVESSTSISKGSTPSQKIIIQLDKPDIQKIAGPQDKINLKKQDTKDNKPTPYNLQNLIEHTYTQKQSQKNEKNSMQQEKFELQPQSQTFEPSSKNVQQSFLIEYAQKKSKQEIEEIQQPVESIYQGKVICPNIDQVEENSRKSQRSHVSNPISEGRHSEGETSRSAPIWQQPARGQLNNLANNTSYLSESTKPNTVNQSAWRPQAPSISLSRGLFEREMAQSFLEPTELNQQAAMFEVKFIDMQNKVVPQDSEKIKQECSERRDEWDDEVLQRVNVLKQDSIIKVEKVCFLHGKKYFQLELSDNSLGLVSHKKMKKLYPNILCDFYEDLLKDDPRLDYRNPQTHDHFFTKQQNQQEVQ